MSATTQSPTTTSKATAKLDAKKEAIYRAFRRQAGKTKRAAQSAEAALSEKYDGLKDTLERNKSAHDYNRRVERFGELIESCQGNRLMGAAIVEAETAFKGFPLADASSSAAQRDWSDEHMKVGLAAAKLAQARKDAEAKARDGLQLNPGVATIITQVRAQLDQRLLPDAMRVSLAKKADGLAYLVANNPADMKTLAKAGTQLKDEVDKAAGDARDALAIRMAQHSKLSSQLAGSEAPDVERLAIADTLQRAESAARIYDFTAADTALAAAETSLGAPGTLPTASGLGALITPLLNKLTALGNSVGSEGKFQATVYNEARSLTAQLESLNYMLAKGGDATAVDGKRLLNDCDKAYGRLAAAAAGHDNFVKTLPAVQQVFDAQCKRVTAAAGALYVKCGAPAGTKGVYDTRIDVLRQGWAAAVEGAICEDDLNLDAVIGELEAIEAEIKASGGGLTPEQIKFDSTANQFITLARQLDAAAETLMANDSAAAFKLGLLTDPAKLRLDGEHLTKSPPPPTELAARSTALAEVNSRISAKLAEIAKVKPDAANNPDVLRASCQQIQADYSARIAAGLVALNNPSLAGKIFGALNVGDAAKERKSLIVYAETLKRDLALAGAPAEAGATMDGAILQATLAELRAFAARITTFEGMCPGDNHVKSKASFEAVAKMVEAVEKKLDLTVMQPRGELTAPWRAVIDAYKKTPTRKEPTAALAELTQLTATIRAAIAAAELEHKAAEAMCKVIVGMMDDVTLAKGELKLKIAKFPKSFVAFMRDLRKASDAIAAADKPDPANLAALEKRRDTLFDLKPGADSGCAALEKTATDAEALYDAAKFGLEEVLAVDIELLEESADDMSGEAKTEMKDQLGDMRKAANGALATLKQNRDPAAAKSMCDAIKSRLKTIEASPLGNSTRNRNELPKVQKRWSDTIDTLHRAIEAVPALVQRACEGDPAALDAARGLEAALVNPVKAMFRPDAFDSAIKRMGVADEAGLADAREDALREIRRLRRVMVSEPLIRQLVTTPFTEAQVPFRPVEMALWDLETNLLTSDT